MMKIKLILLCGIYSSQLVNSTHPEFIYLQKIEGDDNTFDL